MEYQELRAYFFGNMYLSSIQQGIQAAHTVAEMFSKYTWVTEDYELNIEPTRIILYDWAEKHKTMVLLNAGYSEEIRDLTRFFMKPDNPYPCSYFEEGEDALDGALTCAGIILPDTIYGASAAIRNGLLLPESIEESGLVEYIGMDELGTELDISYPVSKWEYQLILRLNNYGLAR